MAFCHLSAFAIKYNKLLEASNSTVVDGKIDTMAPEKHILA